MAIRSVYAPRRRWPVAMLIISSVVAIVAVLIGESAVVLGLCAAWVLSSAATAVLVARIDRGARVATIAVPASVALGGVLAVALLLSAGPLGSALALLAISGGFLAGVLLLGAGVLLAAVTDPPAWLRDEHGRPVPATRRPRYAMRQLRWIAQQRPGRPGVRIFNRARRDMSRMVWRAGTSDEKAFPYFLVVLNPATVRRIDAWMPVQHMAAELAAAYAGEHQAVSADASLVIVQVASDPAVPVGVAAVAASFREPPVAAPVAKAWARMRGLPDTHGLDGSYRYDDRGRTAVLVCAPLVLQQVGGDTRVELPAGGPWTLGRGPTADVRFDDHYVSRLHAQVVELDGGWGIVDRSTRGTLLNGRALAKGRAEPIRLGDLIELGHDSPRRVLLRVG